MRELGDLDHIRHYMRVFNRHLVCQPGYWWTVRSGRSDEDLDVKVRFQALQNFYRFF
jgi:hypothetical protein